MLLRSQLPTSCLARKSSAIPTPATTVSSAPDLIIRQTCCCVRSRGVCVCFVFSFLVSPRGAKRRSVLFFQRMPRPRSKRPRPSFYACKSWHPRGQSLALLRYAYQALKIPLILYDLHTTAVQMLLGEVPVRFRADCTAAVEVRSKCCAGYLL